MRQVIYIHGNENKIRARLLKNNQALSHFVNRMLREKFYDYEIPYCPDKYFSREDAKRRYPSKAID